MGTSALLAGALGSQCPQSAGGRVDMGKQGGLFRAGKYERAKSPVTGVCEFQGNKEGGMPRDDPTMALTATHLI